MSMLTGEKILITGCASQVGLPVARALAADNEVYGLARFRRQSDREKLEALGIRCLRADLADDVLEGVPDDFSLVLHFAVVKSPDRNFDYDLAANAEGPGRLMAHCRRAKAFLHCSSAAVYAPPGHRAVKESDPLGDNHRALMPTYSICKIAAEAMARFGARHWKLPTTIARLSVPYGDNGGWPWFHLMMMKRGQPIPVHEDAPQRLQPAARGGLRRSRSPAARRRPGARDRGELGWQRAREHRGVVRVHGGAHRTGARASPHPGHDREPGARPHADARAARADAGGVARRHPAHDPRPQSGASVASRSLGRRGYSDGAIPPSVSDGGMLGCPAR
jgi:nucleoside-diphosphate-sugar epimerase